MQGGVYWSQPCSNQKGRDPCSQIHFETHSLIRRRATCLRHYVVDNAAARYVYNLIGGRSVESAFLRSLRASEQS